MDITGIRIATQKLRDFPTFHVSPPLSETVPPPGATAANWVCGDFRMQIIKHKFDNINRSLLKGVPIN